MAIVAIFMKRTMILNTGGLWINRHSNALLTSFTITICRTHAQPYGRHGIIATVQGRTTP